jgi:hypothetical protein
MQVAEVGVVVTHQEIVESQQVAKVVVVILVRHQVSQMVL